MADRFNYDVFLSHNAKDKPRVRRLAKRLKEAGLRVWFDEWVVQPGDIIALKVDEGLEQARVLLLCVSPDALASDWVALERSSAIHRDPANEGRRFIPLLLADCELPDTLRRYKYVDYREEGEGAFEGLLSVFRLDAGDDLPAPKKKASKRKPTKQKPPKKAQPETPSEQTEPLAVRERKLTGHKDWVGGVAVSPDGTWAASGSDDKTVKIWDLETGKCRATLIGHASNVNAVAVTLDGMRVLSCSDDNSVRIWDPHLGQELAKLEGHTKWVLSVVALQDNVRALSGGFDKTLKLWDLDSGKCLKTIECGTDGNDDIFTCAVNQTGTHALSGHRDGQIRLWNLGAGECIATLKGHSKIVESIQITPDGRFAVSGSDDKTVKVWDLEAGTCVGTFEGHQSQVQSVAISFDGTLIASAGFIDHSVRLWDWESGACLQVIEVEVKGDSTPISIAFSPNGSRLVIGTTRGSIYLYHLTGVSAAPPSRSHTPLRQRQGRITRRGHGRQDLVGASLDRRQIRHPRPHPWHEGLAPGLAASSRCTAGARGAPLGPGWTRGLPPHPSAFPR